MEVIRSLENKKIKQFASLKQAKYRHKYQQFIIEEKHLIQEAFAKNLIDTLIVLEGSEALYEVNTITVSENVMRKLQSNTSLNEYLAICKIQEMKIEKFDRLVVLENIQIPGNLGTIIRTAYSFGYDGIILTKGCCDIYNEKTIQASQGAMFHIPVVYCDLDKSIALLREHNCQIIATGLKNAVNLALTTKPDKYAIMLGNEGNGLSNQALEASDLTVKIEMDNFESLNVAAAAAICLYYFRNY
ncbi:MAG: TrmH family RNA methyltransferase [Erysipelotrichaceae bacterium]